MIKSQPNFLLIHGNGGGDAAGSWLPNVVATLRGKGFHVTNETFPDNDLARAEIWLPHIEKLGADEHTVIIGHSSGAVAAMRYAERHRLLGSVLVSACYTDLGDETERLSGYYDHAWNWPAITANQQFVLQYASTDDPWIPIEEAHFIHEQLGSTYHEHHTRGHFLEDSFPELVPAVLALLSQREVR